MACSAILGRNSKNEEASWKRVLGDRLQAIPNLSDGDTPGGKLREFGPESLSDSEPLAILISTGTKGKTAEKIAEEVLERFGSFKGMANQPLRFYQLKELYAQTYRL